MSYLEAEVELAALRAMPLDSAYLRVPFDRVVKRFKEERSLASAANVLAAVVDGDRQADHVGDHHRAARPGLDRLAVVLRNCGRDLRRQMQIDERTLFQ